MRQALGATAEYAAELEKQRHCTCGPNKKLQMNTKVLLHKLLKRLSKQLCGHRRTFLHGNSPSWQASVQLAQAGRLQDTENRLSKACCRWHTRLQAVVLQDLDSALTATAQVFSKGKVSAEELRQQIGERLPGAFTLYSPSQWT
jgi:hypothetical protein